jgi:predicted DNA-binding transcriptional regulator AlpA
MTDYQTARECAVMTRKGSYLDYAMTILNMGVAPSHKWSNQRQSLRISNESNLIGGESIGGESTADNAPEVAADEDDDADGDGDSDPDRRGKPIILRRSRPHHRAKFLLQNTDRLKHSQGEAVMQQTISLLPTVEHFDRLPGSAHLDIDALKAITGKSRATIYRWIDKGILPKPRKLGRTHNFWTVGDIRRALQG